MAEPKILRMARTVLGQSIPGRGHTDWEISLVPPGMSGANVFCCRDPLGDRWALKRFAKGVSPDRIRQIHEWMLASRENGFPHVPELASFADRSTQRTVGSRLWEMTRWQPGRPAWEGETDPTLTKRVERGAASIARFHDSVPIENIRKVPRTLPERLEHLSRLDSVIRQACAAPIGLTGQPIALWTELEQCRDLLRHRWAAAAEEMRGLLTNATCFPLVVSLRDVHRDHVLFDENGDVTAIIDFDACRVDSPAVDLARWVGSFLWPISQIAGGPTDSVWSAAAAGYRQVRTFSDQEWQLSRTLVTTGNRLALGNWVNWVACERRSFPAGPQAVTCRLRELRWLWDVV